MSIDKLIAEIEGTKVAHSTFCVDDVSKARYNYNVGLDAAMKIINEHCDGKVLVPAEKIETIQQLWIAGYEPDDQLCELFAMIASKGAEDE